LYDKKHKFVFHSYKDIPSWLGFFLIVSSLLLILAIIVAIFSFKLFINSSEVAFFNFFNSLFKSSKLFINFFEVAFLNSFHFSNSSFKSFKSLFNFVKYCVLFAIFFG
jgi:hypothetical protein